MYCSNCGEPVKEGSVFCGNCGQRINNQEGVAGAVRELSGTVLNFDSGSNSTDGQVDFEPLQAKGSRDCDGLNGDSTLDAVGSDAAVEKEVTTVTNVARPIQQMPSSSGAEAWATGKIKESSRQDYLSSNDLWTWLKKDERRQLFYSDDRDLLSEEYYMALVARQLIKNDVPATIVRKTIRWDNSSIQTESYFVKPSSTAVNPLSCMLHFSTVGRFSFIEQKTFLAPPNLPPYPGKKKSTSGQDEQAKLLLYGVICMAVGVIGASVLGPVGSVLFVVGLIMAGLGYPALMKAREISEYNAQCDKQEAAYNRAWKDWEDTVFLHSFQESTNGKISRIYQSVFECIRQVNAEQFKNHESTDERVDTSMSELRQQISSLKESYR